MLTLYVRIPNKVYFTVCVIYIPKYSLYRFMKHKELETEQMGLYFILYVIF